MDKPEKKEEKEEKKYDSEVKEGLSQEDVVKEMQSRLPKEITEKLKEKEKSLGKLQKHLLEKFGEYIVGLTYLPDFKKEKKEGAEEDEEEELVIDPSKTNILVLIDDSDSKKMSKEDLKEKLGGVIAKAATEIDKDIKTHTYILSEVWQDCLDSKYDILETIAMSAPIFDNGYLAAIKFCEIHKSMVLKKFERYIVSYVLSGSVMRGEAKPGSDIDVFIVIDDTDVKKMTRAELKDKLRAIIVGMSMETAEMIGVKNRMNIQVYILTDFWDSLKEANPVIFTLLRDGVPFFDRGMFMPWKQLLDMGKVKPSEEAIDMYMHSGEQVLKRIQLKLNEIAMEDVYYALLTPSQSALMIYGVPPPAPVETARLMKEVFVDKEKLLDQKYVDILEKVVKLRKEIEKGKKTDVTGKECDEIIADAKDYMKTIRGLFDKIGDARKKESVIHSYETAITITRDVLKSEGIMEAPETDILDLMKKELVNSGKIPENILRNFEKILDGKKQYDDDKLTGKEIELVNKESRIYIKDMIEYLQKKRGLEMERSKIKVSYKVKDKELRGEVVLLDDKAFLILDSESDTPEVKKAKLTEDGAIKNMKESTMDELESAMNEIEMPEKVFIKEPIFEDLKKIYGEEVEIKLK